jgi:hypothetical protein
MPGLDCSCFDQNAGQVACTCAGGGGPTQAFWDCGGGGPPTVCLSGADCAQNDTCQADAGGGCQQDCKCNSKGVYECQVSCPNGDSCPTKKPKGGSDCQQVPPQGCTYNAGDVQCVCDNQGRWQCN